MTVSSAAAWRKEEKEAPAGSRLWAVGAAAGAARRWELQ